MRREIALAEQDRNNQRIDIWTGLSELKTGKCRARIGSTRYQNMMNYLQENVVQAEALQLRPHV